MVNWNECEHVWQEKVYSEYSNENFTDVVCVKCGVPGQRSTAYGDVYWPAT